MVLWMGLLKIWDERQTKATCLIMTIYRLCYETFWLKIFWLWIWFFRRNYLFTCKFFIKAYFCWVLLNAEYNSSSESTVQPKKPQMLRCTGCHLEVPGRSWLFVFGACLREKWCSFPQKLASLVAMHIPRYPVLRKVANFAWADLPLWWPWCCLWIVWMGLFGIIIVCLQVGQGGRV